MHSINDTDVSRLSPRSLRHSCDRCHTQKLRCRYSAIQEYPSEHDSCLRCRKAGVKCAFSPRGRVGRPPKVTKQVQEAAFTPRTSQLRSSSTTDLKPIINKWTYKTGYDHVVKADGRQPEGCNGTVDLGTPSAVNVSFDETIGGFNPETELSDSCKIFFGDVQPLVGTCNGFHADTGIIDNAKLVSPLRFDIPSSATPPSIVSGATDLSQLHPAYSVSDSPLTSTDIAAANEPSTKKILDPTLSSAVCYQRLLDLSLRLLHFNLNPDNFAIKSDLVPREIIDFSNELISIISSYFGGAVHQFQGLVESRTDSTKHMHRRDGTSSTNVLSTQNTLAPDSAVIFLLFSCYTQVLQRFEVIADCLHELSYENTLLANSCWGNPGTVSSLLGRSTALHTIRFLLTYLHRSMTIEGPTLGGEHSPFVSLGSEPSSVSCRGLEDDLLGRALREIRGKELFLMQRTQHLQQLIDNSPN